MKVVELVVSVTYDETVTDAESIACALDVLMETALSTPGILEEYDNPKVGEFYVNLDAFADVNSDTFDINTKGE